MDWHRRADSGQRAGSLLVPRKSIGVGRGSGGDRACPGAHHPGSDQETFQISKEKRETI